MLQRFKLSCAAAAASCGTIASEHPLVQFMQLLALQLAVTLQVCNPLVKLKQLRVLLLQAVPLGLVDVLHAVVGPPK